MKSKSIDAKRKSALPKLIGLVLLVAIPVALTMNGCGSHRGYGSYGGYRNNNNNGYGYGDRRDDYGDRGDYRSGAPQRARGACVNRFGVGKFDEIESVNPRGRDRWEMIVRGKHGRHASCIVDRDGEIHDWSEW